MFFEIFMCSFVDGAHSGMLSGRLAIRDCARCESSFVFEVVFLFPVSHLLEVGFLFPGSVSEIHYRISSQML